MSHFVKDVLFHLAILCLLITPQSRGEDKTGAGKQPGRLDTAGDPLPSGAVARFGAARLRHHDAILCVALSPDGRLAASCGGEFRCPGYPIRLWDVASGREIRQFTGHPQHLGTVAFSPDGTTLASVDSGEQECDDTVRLWDVRTGKVIQVLRGHVDPEVTAWSSRYGLAFSPDGKTLASGGRDGNIRLWDVAAGQEIRRWSYGWATALTFSPDGRVLASGSSGGEIRLWESATGKELLGFSAIRLRPLYSLRFTRDGRHLITGGMDGMVRWWDVAKGTESTQVRGALLGICPHGKRVAIRVGEDVEIWEAVERKRSRRFPLPHFWSSYPAGTYYTGGLSADGSLLVAADWNALLVVDTRQGKMVSDPSGHTGSIRWVGFSADDKLILSVGDRTVRSWDHRTGKEVRQFVAHQVPVMAAAKSTHGSALATASWDGNVRLWDPHSGKTFWTAKVERGRGPVLAFSPHEPLLAAFLRGENKDPFRFWDARSGEEVRKFGPPGNGMALAFLRGGKSLALLEQTGIETSELPGGKRQEVIGETQPSRSYTAMAASPDGRVAATAWTEGVSGNQHQVGLWEAASKTLILSWDGHKEKVVSLAYSPTGERLATGGWDGTVHLWDVATGGKLARFTGHRGGVLALAFSDDGRSLVSGGSDCSVLVWDVVERAEERRLSPERLSPDELNSLWTKLLAPQAANAYPAIRKLTAVPNQAVAHLEKVFLSPADSEERVRQLISLLEDRSFRRRDDATQELVALGQAAEAPLSRFLEAKPSPDARKRAAEILVAVRSGERSRQQSGLRNIRTVQILELIGTEEARNLLSRMTQLGRDEELRAEAKAALGRVGRAPVPR